MKATDKVRSWPLSAENRRKLEVFNSRCCRRILNIFIYDVMADHSLTNIKVRTETGINTMESYIELRRARWLEKIANMKPDRIPRMLLGAWLPYARKTGKPFQTIRHGYVRTYTRNSRF